MKQYCRYCAEMVVGDWNYCRAKQKFVTDAQMKRVNTCKEFELNPIDALGENEKGYCERKPKPQAEADAGEQMAIDFGEAMNDYTDFYR